MTIRADIHGNRYKIEASGCGAGTVYVEFMRNNPSRWIAGEDAPAVALAILEAAGWNDDGPDHDEYDPANVILTNLRDIVQDLADEKRRAQKREAEDAKVRAFRESSLSAIASVFHGSRTDDEDWAGLSGTGREGWRAHYRAARKFFEEEQ